MPSPIVRETGTASPLWAIGLESSVLEAQKFQGWEQWAVQPSKWKQFALAIDDHNYTFGVELHIQVETICSGNWWT